MDKAFVFTISWPRLTLGQITKSLPSRLSLWLSWSLWWFYGFAFSVWRFTFLGKKQYLYLQQLHESASSSQTSVKPPPSGVFLEFQQPLYVCGDRQRKGLFLFTRAPDLSNVWSGIPTSLAKWWQIGSWQKCNLQNYPGLNSPGMESLLLCPKIKSEFCKKVRLSICYLEQKTRKQFWLY